MQAGLKLSGRYALQALLGSGGMGEVWRGVDEHLGRPVAVKVLREHLADPERAGRFRREATIGARLQHPGITVVHDVGTDNVSYSSSWSCCMAETWPRSLRKHPPACPSMRPYR